MENLSTCLWRRICKNFRRSFLPVPFGITFSGLFSRVKSLVWVVFWGGLPKKNPRWFCVLSAEVFLNKIGYVDLLVILRTLLKTVPRRSEMVFLSTRLGVIAALIVVVFLSIIIGVHLEMSEVLLSSIPLNGRVVEVVMDGVEFGSSLLEVRLEMSEELFSSTFLIVRAEMVVVVFSSTLSEISG